MSVAFFTAGRGAVPAVPFASSVAVLVADIGTVKAYRPARGDIAYLDVSGLDDDARRKALSALRKRCPESAWAVVDPEGTVGDPAALFFAGASDYLGPEACGAGVDKPRIRAALAFAASRGVVAAPAGLAACPDGKPAPSFEGWKSIVPGSMYPFYFLYVSVSAHMNLKTRLGESGYITFRDKLRMLIQQSLSEADPLLWMETDAGALFLIPPPARNVAAATEACLRMLLGAPLIACERLGLPFPVRFSFAMHCGTTEYAPPGRTGTIVSDAVNYSFHLGAKKAEPGRLTVSGEAAPLVVTRAFEDVFVPAGSFEGRAVLHSRRFGG